MASNYPPPPPTAASLTADGSAPAQEQQPIERVSRPSPQLGQGPPPPQSYQQSQQGQGLSASPQEHTAAHQAHSHQYHNHGDNGHGSSTDQIEAAAAAAAAAVAAAHHGLAALQEATVQQQNQAGPTSHYPPPPPPSATPLNAGIQYQLPPGSGTPSQPKHQAAPKATRLRRACDMCSARKVKVSVVSALHTCGICCSEEK